jgi:hypothetical protein
MVIIDPNRHKKDPNRHKKAKFGALAAITDSIANDHPRGCRFMDGYWSVLQIDRSRTSAGSPGNTSSDRR